MQKFKKIALPVLGILCLVMAFQATAVGAQQVIDLGTELDEIGAQAGYDVTGQDTLPSIIGRIINAVLGFLGVVLIVIIIYAGFLWMTAGGSEEQVGKAKQWMINAIIGLVIVLLAYAITSFVVTKLAGTIGGIDVG